MLNANHLRGIDHFRAILCRAATGGRGSVEQYAEQRYGDRVAYLARSAVAAGSIGSGAWGAVLATPEQMEFFAAVEQQSVVGRLGLRPVALNVRTVHLVASAAAYWVGAGQPKPLSKSSLQGDTLSPLKIAATYVLTKEMARTANSKAEAGLRSDLQRVLAEGIDAAFFDAGNSGVTDEMPASVLDGVSPIASVGTPEVDVAALIAGFSGDLMAASFVTDPVTAAQIALARDDSGAVSFSDASPRGGSILGMPLLVSRASPRDSSGGQLALIDGGAIAYGSEGVRSVVSDQATLAMDDDPDSPEQQVSLFQTNSVAILSEVGVNWSVVRDGAAAVVVGIDYAVVAS